MRVTNAMLSNNMMLGLNKNMNHLNKLYDQMSSLKKIQRPSDDPIILGRSLKLRLNVLETEQYKTNVGEAKSWMEISENSMNNAHEIYDTIRTQYVQAANGPLGVDDRQKILETVKQLKNQLIQESNANYAGRNVFGGYKTDQKVLFDKDIKKTPADEFKQAFGKDDVETVTYREQDYHRIRLPYGDVTFKPTDPTDPTYDPTNPNAITGLGGVTVRVISSAADLPVPPASVYNPGATEAYFLEETGELIMHADTAEAMAGITINYQKSEFKAGDPNPEVFFNATGNPPVYGDSKLSQKIEYEIGIGTKMDINVLGKDIFDPLSLRDIDEIIHILESYEATEDGPIADEKINLSNLFTGGIGKMDKALSTVSTQIADLGSRMKRLDLTEKRLGDDEISYTELLSRTEDVELERAFIDFNTQYAVYQSALQVTAKVVQPTLMDFLR